MKVTVTYREILEAMPALDKLMGREFKPPATPVKLAILHRIVAPVHQDIQTRRESIVMANADKDEAGEIVWLDKEKGTVRINDAIEAQIKALFETTHDFDAPAIGPNDLEVIGGKPLTPADLYMLVPFLKVD
ncbi:MAG: hypothetical protein IPK79_00030 [Vampirovibrionales bacterium]|nr:hypothetical protein [Vampirovibrionales bacterium]